jgi:hypothetical protein
MHAGQGISASVEAEWLRDQPLERADEVVLFKVTPNAHPR